MHRPSGPLPVSTPDGRNKSDILYRMWKSLHCYHKRSMSQGLRSLGCHYRGPGGCKYHIICSLICFCDDPTIENEYFCDDPTIENEYFCDDPTIENEYF